MKQWYYAKGGQKFGPFQKSHVLELYQKGEIAPNDLVWEEGTAEWVAAEKALGPLTVNNETAPPPVPAETVGANGELSFSAYIQRSWDLLWRYPGELIGSSLLMGILSVLIVLPYVCGSIWLESLKYNLHDPKGILALVLYVGGLLFSSCLQPFVISGLAWIFLRTVRGETPNFGDLAIGLGKHAKKLVLCGLVIGLSTGLFFDSISFVLPHVNHWLPLLWLPVMMVLALLVSVYYSFVLTHIIARDYTVPRALARITSVMLANWAKITCLLFVYVLLSLIGMAVCFVGLLFTSPLASLVMMMVYQHLFKDDSERE